MKKALLVGIFLLICSWANGQEKWALYINYQVFSYTSHSFDRHMLSVDDRSASTENLPFGKSYTVGFIFPALINLYTNSNTLQESVNFGVGLRYRMGRFFYAKAELDLFRKSSPLVQYTSFDIPIHLGVRLNPDSRLKVLVEGGIAPEIGKLKRQPVFSIFTPLIGGDFVEIPDDYLSYPTSRMKSIVLYTHIGFGLEYYNTSLNFRLEKSISPQTKALVTDNTNLLSTTAYRVVLSIPFPKASFTKGRTSATISK